MHVIATAGHVDHGKSTLVRALTGMEPDRWAEERRRGMTIDLGFAWTRLPGGAEVAFVDVPGHERFVSNMLAGVGPVPAALLVVAADEGWMPQTAEHVAALDALGVSHAVLAVTRSDLADPAPAIADVRERLRETSLAGLPAVAVSAPTGAGLDELRALLGSLVASLPEPDAEAPVRLWVDRAFTIRGSGTVVTGTLSAGTLRTGDELELNGRGVRIRGLRSLGEPHETVSAIARVAVNLRNVEKDDVGRGDALLTPGRWTSAELADVRVEGDDLETAPGTLVLHLGSAAVPVRIRLLRPAPASPAGAAPHGRADGAAFPAPASGAAAPAAVDGVAFPAPARGDAARAAAGRDADSAAADSSAGNTPAPQFARLTLGGPLPLVAGDRALLRDPGGHRVVGRVTVLDTAPAPLSRRGAAAARAAELATLSREAGPGADAGSRLLRRRKLIRAAELRGLGAAVPAGAVSGADWLLDPNHATELREQLRKLLAEHRATGVLTAGPTVEEARTALGLPHRSVLLALIAAPLTVRDGRVVDRDGPPPLPEPVAAAVAVLAKDLTGRPFRAPEAGRLTELGLGPRELAAAERAGALLRLAENVVLLPGADQQAAAILAGLEQPFTTSQARQALDTSRRTVLPLLALLDRRHLTRRLPDDRRETLTSI